LAICTKHLSGLVLNKNLRLVQKSLSIKTKSFSNYHKLRLKLATIHVKIKDLILEDTHKLKTQIIREN
ncbi:MAG: hypothetical protein O4750_12190, partial [Trichodesmium sp. St18_bin3_1_1]|nr:hypothetical protein [Trichodesmium sp. St18_bin3_1_1]